MNIAPALAMLAQGTAGIFAVLGIIALVVAFLKKLDNPRSKLYYTYDKKRRTELNCTPFVRQVW